MKHIVLSEDQRKLAEENHQLIYSYAKQQHLSIDIFYDILAIALCLAAYYYDDSLGHKFSTLAYKFMRVAVRNYCQHENNKSHVPIDQIDHLDQESGLTSTSNGYQYLAHEDADYSGPIVDEFIAKLSDNQKRFLELRLQGFTVKDISDIENVSKQYVYQTLKIMQKKWNIHFAP